VQQTLAAIPVVQAFAQEDREQRRFDEFTAAALKTIRRGTLLSSIAALGSGGVATAATVAIVVV